MSNVVSVELSDEVKKQLDTVAEYLGKTHSWVIEKAIEKYLAEEMEEIRFLQEGEKNLAEMKEKGNGMSLQELADYLGYNK